MPIAPCLEALTEQVRSCAPEAALVLGTGLGGIAERLQVRHAVCFSRIPALAAPGVAGHQGRLLLGRWCRRSVLVFSGRNHFYEGHPWDRVVAPVRLLAAWGVRRLLLTNAAGGIRPDLVPGSLLAIRAHFDLTGAAPWRGHGLWRKRSPYSDRLVALLTRAAGELGFHLAEGTYAAVTGPNYETPAEIRALHALGADAVGMSTAREAAAAAALGLECAAVSCITNRAAGLSPTRLSHEEVLLTSRSQASRLGDLLERVVAKV